MSENLRIEKPKCKQWHNIYYTLKGEGRSLKKLIVFGIMLMLLAVYSSATIVANSQTGGSIVISPDTTAAPNSTFMLNLTINNVANMYGWSVTLIYQNIISLDLVTGVSTTAFFNSANAFVSFEQEDFNSSYYRGYVFGTLLNGTPGSTGSGLVAQLNFATTSIGTVAISCVDSEVENNLTQPVSSPITVTTPTITIATPPPTPPPTPPTTPSSVGGISFSLAKPPTFDYLAPILAIIAFVAILLPTVYFKGIKRRKEKQ